MVSEKKKKKRSSPKLSLIFWPKSEIQTFFHTESPHLLHNFGTQFPLGGAVFNFSPKIGLKSNKNVQFCILHKPMGGLEPPRPPLATLVFQCGCVDQTNKVKTKKKGLQFKNFHKFWSSSQNSCDFSRILKCRTKKKRSSSQKFYEIRCESTKITKVRAVNTNLGVLGLDLHFNSPEPVNFFGAQLVADPENFGGGGDFKHKTSKIRMSSPKLRVIFRPKSEIQTFFSPKIRWSPKKKKGLHQN